MLVSVLSLSCAAGVLHLRALALLQLERLLRVVRLFQSEQVVSSIDNRHITYQRQQGTHHLIFVLLACFDRSLNSPKFALGPGVSVNKLHSVILPSHNSALQIEVVVYDVEQFTTKWTAGDDFMESRAKVQRRSLVLIKCIVQPPHEDEVADGVTWMIQHADMLQRLEPDVHMIIDIGERTAHVEERVEPRHRCLY
ncbi:hypothetical protein F4808DRAFT_370195 [Astrocystis sublimbata]|nr:hypothetical protein F4808DRAFT_370195 [Astrocystis sublimbata]